MNSALAELDARLASNEANHRFLNTLTALSGLLRTDFGGFADPAVLQAVSVFSSRIQAFASVHRTLSEDADDGPVDAAAHLARLCAELCEAHLAPRGLHCDFQADPGTLPREVCQHLGLIIVELVTNAAKHAFNGRTGGLVRVCLRRTAHGWLCVVADNGSGLRGGGNGGNGGGRAGMRLVHGLAEALDGDLCIRSDVGGVIVTLSLPDAPFTRTVDRTAGTWHAC
jgi:two-component sensor histidine kinase